MTYNVFGGTLNLYTTTTSYSWLLMLLHMHMSCDPLRLNSGYEATYMCQKCH